MNNKWDSKEFTVFYEKTMLLMDLDKLLTSSLKKHVFYN